MKPKLVLASTSSYRSALLSHLSLHFLQYKPSLEESVIVDEAPRARASRLAQEKSQSVAHEIWKSAIIIGTDQVAHRDGIIQHKPGDFQSARSQLQENSGHWVSFCTAVCLTDETGSILAKGVDVYDIKYRALSLENIDRYLLKEQPFDCAGAIKAESLGIALIEEGRGRDINTLYGLPLILLIDLFAEIKMDLFKNID